MPDTDLNADQRPLIGSLFSGYGGLDLAVEAVLGGTTAWVSDIDNGACKVLNHRFPDVPNIGDITTVDWSQVEPVDVLTAGFPCQDVSLAGKRAGLRHGTRSGLWIELVKAIGVLRPSLVVIENVRGLLSARGDEPTDAHLAAENAAHACKKMTEWIELRRARALREGRIEDARRLAARRGRVVGCRKRALGRAKWHERRLVRAIGTVLGDLADIGYDCRWHGLRAADVGAPHGRFRVFVVAYPAGNPPGHDFGQQPELGSGRTERTQQSPGGADSDPATLLPTPRTSDTNGAGPHGDAGIDLRTAVTELHGKSLAIEAQRLLPTPEASRAGGTPERHLERKRLADGSTRTVCTNLDLVAGSDTTDWGVYADAITPWQTLTRPAPPPTQPSKKGTPQLSARFSEWMMGLPDGWVTGVPGITRNEALKAIGNGVCVQQAAAALRFLLGVGTPPVGASTVLLPTPGTLDHIEKRTTHAGGNLTLQGALGGVNPVDAARHAALLPTPRASDGEKGGPNQRGSSGDLMLPSAVMGLPPDADAETQRLLPTPTAQAAKHSADDRGPGTLDDGNLWSVVTRLSPDGGAA